LGQFPSAHYDKRPSAIGAPERPSSPAEIIMLLLAAGLTRKQIRAMYPGLFPNFPEPAS